MNTRSHHARLDSDLVRELSEGVTTFRFKTVTNVERTTEQLRDQRRDIYLAFTGVPQDEFERLAEDETSTIYHARFFYVYNHQFLLIMTPSPAHEAAAATFSHILSMKFGEMKIGLSIASCGSAPARMKNVTKQPDGCWGPSQKLYKTMILEVGYSESSKKLAIDARVWLEKPDSESSHARQVVIIKIDPTRPCLVFRRYEQGIRQYGATRAGHPRQAQLTEEREVLIEDGVPTANGNFTLSFTSIFERPPIPGTPEREAIIFTPEELCEIARQAWMQQKFVQEGIAME